ncbi:hypothetical protein [Paenibacillus sp. yr247]|uniref:hypothetical protein n=1 Tax=Paenibacillus sp. yr247 TaxID=1761880 RepID=UPI001587E9A1|nr:hypothetical protein [Paenibacillus sp. yr247]
MIDLSRYAKIPIDGLLTVVSVPQSGGRFGNNCSAVSMNSFTVFEAPFKEEMALFGFDIQLY